MAVVGADNDPEVLLSGLTAVERLAETLARTT